MSESASESRKNQTHIQTNEAISETPPKLSGIDQLLELGREQLFICLKNDKIVVVNDGGNVMILLEKKWRLPESLENRGVGASDTNIPDGGTTIASSALVGRLLQARGITSQEEVQAFLARDAKEWHDPFLMNDMDTAVERILAALQNKEKILICGDYDADGVTSTAILMSFFRKLGAEVTYVIPDRMTEGYGVSSTLIDRIQAESPNLVITVDCGIANYEEIDDLMQSGTDVIVTDHHEVKELLPPALAVVDCKRTDNTYPFEHLCGAGVALKLVAALCGKLSEASGMPAGMPTVQKDDWREYIDIAALGTIADVVSLTGENRDIVKNGIVMLNKMSRPGLAALLSLIREMNGKAAQNLSATDIAFQVVPKINACGRLGDAARAVELLLTDDPSMAKELSGIMIEENTRRQEMEQTIVDEAVKKIESSPEILHSLKNDSMPIVISGENWHAGILGIVASRLVERYQHSALVFSTDPGRPGVLKGSCRTAGDFPILECLKYCGDSVQQFGGHQRAAGVSVEESKFEEFQHKVSAFAEERNNENDVRFLLVDSELDTSEITLESAEELRALEPFGEGNREPVFLVRKVKIVNSALVGNGKHLKLQLQLNDEKKQVVDAIAFSVGDVAEMYVPGTTVDVLVRLLVNSWNGVDSLKLQVVDMHHVETGKTLWDKPQVLENLYRNKLPLKQIQILAKCGRVEDLLPNGEEMGVLYRFLRATFREEVNMVDLKLLARLLTGHFKKPFHAFKIARALDMFAEAGLLELVRISDERICFSLLSVKSKVKLEDTETYRTLYGGN